mmetsp:Transcript_36058/g.95766  ORF Transcript_36058/g.95766 Transcript_36058/m.95766 type:complete len:245 (-) Transcript_36058:2143-2877(-)
MAGTAKILLSRNRWRLRGRLVLWGVVGGCATREQPRHSTAHLALSLRRRRVCQCRACFGRGGCERVHLCRDAFEFSVHPLDMATIYLQGPGHMCPNRFGGWDLPSAPWRRPNLVCPVVFRVRYGLLRDHVALLQWYQRRRSHIACVIPVGLLRSRALYRCGPVQSLGSKDLQRAASPSIAGGRGSFLSVCQGNLRRQRLCPLQVDGRRDHLLDAGIRRGFVSVLLAFGPSLPVSWRFQTRCNAW